MKLENIILIVVGAVLIDGSFWFSPPHTGYGLVVPVFLGLYFIFTGVFGFSPIEFYMNRKSLYRKETRKSTIISSENNNNSLSLEEQYYYKGRTNQQLQRYNEAWQCYTNSLSFNPNFEPSKKAKKEIENTIKLKHITIERYHKNDWFKYGGLGGIAKPINWQGWVCYSIFFLSIFLLSGVIIILHGNFIFIIITFSISVILFQLVTKIKSNFRELNKEYKNRIR